MRLQEIRERLEMFESMDTFYCINNDDVMYLLNRIERYEEVIKQFADHYNWMGKNKLNYPDFGIVEWDGEKNPIKMAEEALKGDTE